jgi:hypothetical protein
MSLKSGGLHEKHAVAIGIWEPSQIVLQNSVRTSKRTPHFTITKINWLMLFREIITVYSENHAKPIIFEAEGRLNNI